MPINYLTLTKDEWKIVNLLNHGQHIRRIDARYMGGFVNQHVLESMIERGMLVTETGSQGENEMVVGVVQS